MQDIISIIEKLYGSEKRNSEEFIECLQRIYLGYIIPRFRLLRMSEDYRQARDLSELDVALQLDKSLGQVKFISHRYKNDPVIQAAIAEEPRKPATELRLRDLLKAGRAVSAAALAADLLNREARRSNFRWLITVLLTVLSILTALILQSLGGGNVTAL